jgi:hypothetical protein
VKALIVMGVAATAVAPRPLAPVHRPGPRRPDPHRRLGVLPGPGVVRRAGVGLLLALVVSGCSPGNETPATTTVTVTTTPVVSTATPTPPPPPPPVQKGQWAYDDMLAFKVCWAYHTDDNATVFMCVQNVGGGPATYSTRLQRLVDEQGRVFASARGAKDDGHGHYDEISDLDLNPGLSASVLVGFQVPVHGDADPVDYRLVAHGSRGSPAVVMRISLHPEAC